LPRLVAVAIALPLPRPFVGGGLEKVADLLVEKLLQIPL